MKLDYNQVAADYKNYRVPDRRIQAQINAHLIDAKRVLNVGAGMGAYEPEHCEVIALEPSAEMIARRPSHKGVAIKGSAEHLPFADKEFDAVMAILTIHHWNDVARGLAEMRRVSRGKVLLLTWIYSEQTFWLEEYFPKIRQIDERIFPSVEQLGEMLGPVHVETVPIPFDCSDGFQYAYWRRPHMYLEENARQAISSFHKIGSLEPGLTRLQNDLQSGVWARRYADLLDKTELDFGYRLVVTEV